MKKNLTCCLGLLGALTAMQSTASFALQWGEEDKLRDFVGRINQEPLLNNAQAIEAAGLMGASLPETPWSSTFWPDNKGSIADPYEETGRFFENLLKKWHWSSSRPYLVSRSELHRDILNASQVTIDNLSPAEKYDLLMGDLNFTLTNRVIKMIDERYAINLTGVWSGVCHGWSPASLNTPRPKHSIRVMSPIGRTITFYPDDIKGLTAFLWGKSPVQNSAKSDGFQCQSGAHTNKYGRLTDPRCADSNPAFFHLAAVNQIGLNHRGFVMDRAYTAEVQNQPVYAYNFKFYKVTDRHPSPGMSLERAKVANTSSLWDPYRTYRSPRATSIVGVEATVRYGFEKDPAHHETDDAGQDKTDHLTLRYDLELDSNNEIVGGEWREYDDAGAPTLAEQIGYKHPDMIWLIPPGIHAWSLGDADTGDVQWNGVEPMPQIFRTAGLTSANNTEKQTFKGTVYEIPQPQPLGKVVEKLLELSRQ